MRLATGLGILLMCVMCCCTAGGQVYFDKQIKPAAEDTRQYVPQLKGRKVAMVINQTSRVGDSSLLDVLLVRGIKVTKIFVPEHGFRGREDAGADIKSSIDSATGLPVISLHGASKKPAAADMADIDVLVYDLQDVGVRFYTYISTLEYCMEACAENSKELLVLDRPNPNGFYVDGPVLKREFRSFVGMQPVPVVYGLTVAEYAAMLVGERWLKGAEKLKIKYVRCTGYDHKKKYELPVAPSPNLRTMAAILAYPSLCFFEGTVVSVGRGTDLPFQQYGCPAFKGAYPYRFVPRSGPGAKAPLYEGQECWGEVLGRTPYAILEKTKSKLTLQWLIRAYNASPEKEKFFNPFFTKLAGTDELEQQIKKGMTELEIKQAWAKDLAAYKAIRKKYLMYKDFDK